MNKAATSEFINFLFSKVSNLIPKLSQLWWYKSSLDLWSAKSSQIFQKMLLINSRKTVPDRDAKTFIVIGDKNLETYFKLSASKSIKMALSLKDSSLLNFQRFVVFSLVDISLFSYSRWQIYRLNWIKHLFAMSINARVFQILKQSKQNLIKKGHYFYR